MKEALTVQNTSSNRQSGRQPNTSVIHTHDFTIEYTLQPLATEWSIPNLMQYGFKVISDVTDFDDVELTLSIPIRIPTLKILSALFENDMQTISFSVFRGDDKFKSDEPIVLSESEPEINGHIYLEAVILNKTYLYKYVFRAVLKRKPMTRPKTKTAVPARKTIVTVESQTPKPVPKPEPVKVIADSSSETIERLKKLEETAERLLSVVEGLKINAPQTTAQSETTPEEPSESRSVPLQDEFDEFREMLRQRFADYARHNQEQSKAEVPPELEDDPVFHTFQELRQALSPTNSAIQSLKKSDASFRLPILTFSATIDDTLKKMLAPIQSPEFYDVSIVTFKEFLLSGYFDYLGQWMDSETEPPIEAFDHIAAYRRYIFNRYRQRLLDIKTESKAKTFTDEYLVNELKKIKESLLIKHIEEIESIEKRLVDEIVDLAAIVDDYFMAILKPLGMAMNRNGSAPRVIRTLAGQAVRPA